MRTRFVMSVKTAYGDLVGGFYGQMDGYPDEWPRDILEKIADRTLVNGITPGSQNDVINGLDNLLVMMIYLAELELAQVNGAGLERPPAGQFYAWNWDPQEVPESAYLDYVYVITGPTAKEPLKRPIPIKELKITVYHFGKKEFEGTIGEFLEKYKE